MANSLLDFVMSLVRDPEAAARYAENPDQAILDANLTDVTSVDVNNLIPVVAESMSTVVPTAGADSIVGEAAGNVWASGAATAAFDAFDDHVPVSVESNAADDVPSVISDLADSPEVQSGLDVLADAGIPGVVEGDGASLQLDQPIIEDLPAAAASDDADLSDTVIEVDDLDSNASGFDIF